MTLSHRKSVNIAVACCSLGSAGCLPTDTRPPPASVFVEASSDDAVRKGFSTDDGWNIEFTRFLITLGRTSLDGDACNPYSDARYERVLDMQQPPPQKVTLLYGLGQCDFTFSVTHPVSDSVIGAGVTSQEALMMQTAGSDKYTAPTGQLAGINTYVTGVASRGDEHKTFAWSFRQDYNYKSCTVSVDAGPAQGLNLHGHDSDTVDLLVRGETLFQTDVDPSKAKLLFEPIAMADSVFGNADGQVTLDELGLVPILVSGATGVVVPVDAGNYQGLGGFDAGNFAALLDGGFLPLDGSVNDYVAGDGGVTSVGSLEDFVYLMLFPRIVRYQDTGGCASIVARIGRGRD